MSVKRIRDEAEYKTGGNSDFIGLDEGEKFVGYFLGQADPKIDDPAFFPYKTHWIGKTSVPCADEDCIYCEDGEKPRSKAYTLWLVTTDEAGKKLGKPAGSGDLRIFDMPVSVIKQFNELRSEGDTVQGAEFRVARTDEMTYVLVPKTQNKPLTKSKIKELVKSDDAPDFEQMLNNKLKKAMEGVAVSRALEDDEDEKPARSGERAGKGKKADKKGKKSADEWPDDGIDEETVTVSEVDDDGNWIEVTHDDYEGVIKVWTTDDIDFDLSTLGEGDEVTVTTGEKDSDGEYVLTEEPETSGDDKKPDGEVEDIEDVTFELVKVSKKNNSVIVEHDGEEIELVGGDDIDLEGWKKGHEAIISAEYDADEETWELTAIAEPEADDAEAGAAAAKDDNDLPDIIEGEEAEVVSVDEASNTIDVKTEDFEFELFFLDTMKVDFDDYEPGDKITITAEKDRQGDLVATEIPEKVGGKKGGKKSSDKKGSKKGGKGKSK